ncbi:MAG: serine hydrolase [Phycisphaerales bacterium JB040]
MRPTAAAIALTALALPAAAQPQGATWDNIDRVLAAEERKGFSGAVLLVRDGEIVLNEGYGLADRDNNIPNTPDTIFALGSTPIDFTHVAILQLLDRGKLDLNDPVSKFFDGFTGAHATITLDHLRTGRSGLPDFPAITGVDADPDHSPLSRDAFIERTRNARLLFTPGEDDVHSHWAWGVLAAVVEVASGQSYPDYIREHVLGPAGMTRTGFFGETFPGETVAVGYGPRSDGEINSPPYWGPTSWLVMGSGGMVGTTGDLLKFHNAIDNGTLIPDAVFHIYPSRGVYANGDLYGFETYYNYGPGDRFYLNCNANNPINPSAGYNVRSLAETIIDLVLDEPTPRFSIGIAFGRERGPNGDVVVASDVPPGRPAHDAGLRPGDVLVSANGEPFDPRDPLVALHDSIENGTTLRLEIERDGKPMTLTITPRAMNIEIDDD